MAKCSQLSSLALFQNFQGHPTIEAIRSDCTPQLRIYLQLCPPLLDQHLYDWVKEICINELPEGYIENENYDDSQPTENFISVNDLVASDDLKLWNMPNLEEHKVIFMAEEDIYGVNVFVGNNLEDVKTLRYCKVNENICEIDKVAEKY